MKKQDEKKKEEEEKETQVPEAGTAAYEHRCQDPGYQRAQEISLGIARSCCTARPTGAQQPSITVETLPAGRQ
jgi:hypothetical protein